MKLEKQQSVIEYECLRKKRSDTKIEKNKIFSVTRKRVKIV